MRTLSGFSPLRDRGSLAGYDPVLGQLGQYEHGLASMRSMSSFGGLLLEPKGENSSKAWQVGVSLFVTLVGTGVLAMPRAAEEAGYVGFVSIILGVVVITILGCYLTFRTLDLLRSHDADVAHVGYTVMGAKGFHLALAVCLVDTWGTIVGNIRAVADTVYSFIGPETVTLPTVVYVVSLLVLPLTLSKSIGDLKIISIYALGAMLFFCYAVTSGAVEHGDVWPTLEATPKVNGFGNVVSSMSVVFFAFDCQVNLFPLYREIQGRPGMKTPSLTKLATLAVFCAALLYIMLGLSGFVSYGDETHGNILDNLQHQWFVKSVFASAVFFTLPVLIHECGNLLFLYLLPPNAHPVIPSLIMIGSASLFAASSPVYSTFRYLGATAGLMFTCILPPLFFLCMVLLPPTTSHEGLEGIPNVESMPLLDGLYRVASYEGPPSPSVDPEPPRTIELLLSAVLLISGLIAMPAIVFELAHGGG